MMETREHGGGNSSALATLLLTWRHPVSDGNTGFPASDTQNYGCMGAPRSGQCSSGSVDCEVLGEWRSGDMGCPVSGEWDSVDMGCTKLGGGALDIWPAQY